MTSSRESWEVRGKLSGTRKFRGKLSGTRIFSSSSSPPSSSSASSLSSPPVPPCPPSPCPTAESSAVQPLLAQIVSPPPWCPVSSMLSWEVPGTSGVGSSLFSFSCLSQVSPSLASLLGRHREPAGLPYRPAASPLEVCKAQPLQPSQAFSQSREAEQRTSFPSHCSSSSSPTPSSSAFAGRNSWPWGRNSVSCSPSFLPFFHCCLQNSPELKIESFWRLGF